MEQLLIGKFGFLRLRWLFLEAAFHMRFQQLIPRSGFNPEMHLILTVTGQFNHGQAVAWFDFASVLESIESCVHVAVQSESLAINFKYNNLLSITALFDSRD